MFPDPSAVLYACVAIRNPNTTILSVLNPENDLNLECSALECLQNTPPHHSTFSYTMENRTYAYLITGHAKACPSDPIIFFAIFDAEKLQDSDHGSLPLLFLNRIRERFDHIVVKKKLESLQGMADDLFKQPLGFRATAPKKLGLKGLCVRFVGLVMCVVASNKKRKVAVMKKQLGIDSDRYSDWALFETTADFKQEKQND